MVKSDLLLEDTKNQVCQNTVSSKTCWCCFIFYLAIFGSYCGLEIDSFVGDTPFFRVATLLLFCNVLFVMLVPPVVWAVFERRRFPHKRRTFGTAILVLNAVYFHIAAFLALYKSVRKIDFDFYFFWYNTADALPALWKLYAPWFAVFAISIAAFVLLQKPAFSPLTKHLARSPRQGWSVLLALFLFSILCQTATIHSVRGSATGFLYASFFSDRQLRNDYGALYRMNIEALRSNAPAASGNVDTAAIGDVIFFVKQESLNGFLTDSRITPRLLQASHNGVLFPRFYANSIQSLRGYECILCGVAPSIAGALVDDYSPDELKDMHCLPKIFKALGYRPLYFFGGSRNARIVHFAESIGFEKVLADDIVRPDDVKFDWGYREDVFFTRVHEYLQRHYADEKLFVFIDTGATNHTPFEVLDHALLDKIPYPRPEKFNERLANTTYVQDAYLGKLFDIYENHYAYRGSFLAISDHSWPAMMHKDNIYNERGAYEENFVIPLLYVPPLSKREAFATGSVIDRRFSQMDIFPTILELIGMRQKGLLGESFAAWLLAAEQSRRSKPGAVKVSVQPYGGGFISAVKYPHKYLFDVLGKNVKVYDLQKDPRELRPTFGKVEDNLHFIQEFFQSR